MLQVLRNPGNLLTFNAPSTSTAFVSAILAPIFCPTIRRQDLCRLEQRLLGDLGGVQFERAGGWIEQQQRQHDLARFT